ncbi:MAG: isoamylase early set domain-containing protein [Syntrophales bacterium]
MKNEECGQEKFDFIEKLVSELHEMQDLLRDRENIKVEYEKEMSQRIRMEEESHKIRTSLEEQLAERGAEFNRITADRERILQVWTQMLDDMRDRLMGSSHDSDKESLTRNIQFEFPAPAAKVVSVVGDFNNWNADADPMEKDKEGVWKTSMSLKPGRYEYRFFVDGSWKNDPACSSCMPNKFGSSNCVRIV